MGYYCTHTLGHTYVRNLFVAQGPDGPIGVSDYLRDLINGVFKDVDEAGYHVPVFDFEKNPVQACIKWFVSSTLDPISYGSTHWNQGVLIGVPNSYNYKKPEELPDELFQIKKLKLMRSPQGGVLDKRKELEKDAMIVNARGPPAVQIRTIERTSEEGGDYTQSLLLSENAKKFAIARELYMGETLRPLAIIGIMTLAFVTGVTAGRGYVQYRKLEKAHVSHRIGGYLVASFLGYGVFFFLSAAVNDFFANQANGKAKALGEEYRLGAEEYFRKQVQRDSILGVKPKFFGI